MRTIKLTILAILLLLTGVSLASAQALDENEYDVYLCIGQSNMAGRGTLKRRDIKPLKGVFVLDDNGKPVPAVAPLNQYSSIRKSMPQQQMNPAWSFGRKMAKKSSKPILLVVQARGGTSIKHWMKDAPRLRYTHSDDLGPEGEVMPRFFDEAVRRTRQAMRYGQLKGILWHQGESDSDTGKVESYMDNLVLLVSQLRAALNAPDVPFVAGEIQEHHQNAPLFNPIIRNISSQIPNSGWVSSKGCKVNSDNLHFTREGQIILGKRYAEFF